MIIYVRVSLSHVKMELLRHIALWKVRVEIMKVVLTYVTFPFITDDPGPYSV